MAKKKSAPDPIVAEEPARPEEQFRLDESQVAPPSTRRTGERSRGTNPYGARSARERRATRPQRVDTTGRRKRDEINARVVEQMLEHPTKQVTEEELRKEYSYVIADLRSMAVLASALLVAIIVLAQILPK